MPPKILEIFRSIQGEGKYAGATQVFVRFFECNMHCAWCDTPHSIGDTTRHYVEMSVEDLFAQIQNLSAGCHSISLTGGEPLLQIDAIKALIPYLKENHLPIYLETNGIFYHELAEIIDDVDYIAMDFKLPSSTKCKAYWTEHEAFLKIAKQKDVFIKAVITSDTDYQDVVTSVELVQKIDPTLLFILQPNYFEMKNGVAKRCVEFQEYCSEHLPNVRIIPQMHKFMRLR